MPPITKLAVADRRIAAGTTGRETVADFAGRRPWCRERLAAAACLSASCDLTLNMIPWLQSAKRFLLADDGPTAVEYAFLVMLLVLIFLTGITMVGQATSRPLETP